jgi:N-acetylgalactosamine-6-sulfatase
MADWLSPKATLMPRLMKQAGYTTAHFGKWHLSGEGKDINPPLPTEYGYDEAAVWVGPGPGVFPGTRVADKEGKADNPIGAAYLTIAATEHALKFIRAAQGKPFYLDLWIHETHHLVAATDADKAAYPDTPEPQRTYFAAVTRADKQVGRVLDLLDELGLTKNTIVIFTSDNGPEESRPSPEQKWYFSVGDTGGLRGRKRSLYLGGVNVPFIVRWPGQVPAGRVDKTSVISGVDMLPTLCAAAGIPLPAEYRPDGLNVLPAFRGEPFTRPQPLFWDWRFAVTSQVANWPACGMREGDWGLVMNDELKRAELYDVVTDRFQEHDLAAQHPERAAAMAKAIREWQSTLPARPNPECVQPRISEPAEEKKSEPRHPNSAPTESNKSTSQHLPNGIEIIRGLEIGNAGDIPLLVDIVKPAKPDKLSPAILAIHGGGWAAGSRVDALAGVRFLADQGYFLCAIDYRLATKAKWPAQLEDCKYAVRWLRAHAAEFQLDPQRIGAMGHSAGAHLAACLGTIGPEAGMEGQSGYSNFSSRVQAVVAWAPPINVQSFLKNDPQRLFGPVGISNPSVMRGADPTTFITRGAPPFLLAHGDQDVVVPISHSEGFAGALRAAGNPVDFVVVKGAGHRMRAETDVLNSSPSYAELKAGMLAFFNQNLGAP